MNASPQHRLAVVRAPRRGFVIVVVLVVVAMISLGSYALVESMYVEHRAARVYGERLQREQALASAIERLAALAELTSAERRQVGGLFDNPAWFQDAPLDPAQDAKAQNEPIYLAVMAPPSGAPEDATVRYGVDDESARLSLAAIRQWELQQPGAGRNALRQLPGMTDAAADGVLDWLDPDSQPRPLGAESDYYGSLPTPYAARNGLPADLRELLLVKKVTPQLLFGLPATNPSGETLDRASPAEGRNRRAAPAWREFLTLWSGERLTRPDGRPRIDLNAPDLARLQQQLAESLEARWAQFIVAYRQFGPYSGSQAGEDASGLAANLSAAARFSLTTPFDLVGARVAIPASGGAPPKVFQSPLSADHAQGGETLLSFFDQVTVGSEPVVRGRLNVNLAPAEALRGVPGMNAAVVQAILSARGDARSAASALRRHAVWLWAEGLLDLETMKRLAPYVNAGGDVYRARAAVRNARGRQLAAADVVVDATARPASIRMMQTDWIAVDGDERGSQPGPSTFSRDRAASAGRSIPFKPSP